VAGTASRKKSSPATSGVVWFQSATSRQPQTSFERQRTRHEPRCDLAVALVGRRAKPDLVDVLSRVELRRSS
jgi:hypothetical protein